MRAVVGDRLHVHGRVVGTPDQTSEIIEIRGQDGAPPYLVRHDDGLEVLVVPGSDASVSTLRVAKAPEVDRLRLFEPIPWVVAAPPGQPAAAAGRV